MDSVKLDGSKAFSETDNTPDTPSCPICCSEDGRMNSPITLEAAVRRNNLRRIEKFGAIGWDKDYGKSERTADPETGDLLINPIPNEVYNVDDGEGYIWQYVNGPNINFGLKHLAMYRLLTSTVQLPAGSLIDMYARQFPCIINKKTHQFKLEEFAGDTILEFPVHLTPHKMYGMPNPNICHLGSCHPRNEGECKFRTFYYGGYEFHCPYQYLRVLNLALHMCMFMVYKTNKTVRKNYSDENDLATHYIFKALQICRLAKCLCDNTHSLMFHEVHYHMRSNDANNYFANKYFADFL